MNLPTLEPITDANLLDYGRFLRDNLDRGRSAEAWAEALRQDWGVAPPNHGFLLRQDGRVVGGIGAIYAERRVRGVPERFCNITSWCVREEFRSQSMRLAMAVTAQPGFHFTDLTPTEVVSKTLQFLKFRPMNERHALWPNVPWPKAWLRGPKVVVRADSIEAVLSPEDARVYRDHRHFPWLRHLAIGYPGAYCHVVFKTCRVKGIPGAFLLAFSDAELLLRYRLALGSHFLLRHGLASTRVESRLLPRLPKPCIELSGFRNKVYLSPTLAEADMSNFYTEILALDL